MKSGKFTYLAPAILIVAMSLFTAGVKAQNKIVPNWKINSDKELNPNTKWLRDAKWGLCLVLEKPYTFKN